MKIEIETRGKRGPLSSNVRAVSARESSEEEGYGKRVSDYHTL